MPKRVLAIGVGGSGKASLTVLKERLIETYGDVPDNVVLLALDTDDLREIDSFAGVRLEGQFDARGREPEFQHVVSPSGITMDTVFADIASGRTQPYMYWLEKERLERVLTQTEKDIRGGAQQRRPIGRTALFQRWSSPIYSSIETAISRMYGNPDDDDEPVDNVDIEKSKRLVFIVGSVAGGTGSGFFIDVANLVRHAIHNNNNWQSIDVSGVIVLPDAFSAYTSTMDDPTNLKPNSYAALRELDRFNRVHSNPFPYMIRYGQDIRSITWSTNQPMDHVYLVDTASRGASSETNLEGNPMRGVFPVVADFIMAHVDQSLGDALATLRSNAGLHYSKQEGWIYSGFNVMTYIFPVNDVIDSFTYRFLHEFLGQQFLPVKEKKVDGQLEQAAAKETDRVFAQNNIEGKMNPGVIQKAIAATRRVEPERPPTDWQGLFGMIALSDSVFAEDYQDLDQSLVYLAGNMLPSGTREYKRETYTDGYLRLFNFSEQFLDDFLGPQLDPDDEDSREGGDWDKILSPYREAIVFRFAQAMDVALLNILNRRHPEHKILEPYRLSYARKIVAILKRRLRAFHDLLEEEYQKLGLDVRVRQVGAEVRDNITWMQNTQNQRKPLFRKADAIKAQEAYVGSFLHKMELMLQQRVYKMILDILKALGAAEHDKDGNLSVLEQVGLELENWQATFEEVSAIVRRWERIHSENREAKRRVRVRRYLTDDAFEDQLYQQPEHWGSVYPRVLGQIRGERGLNWQRKEEDDEANALAYRLITTWGEEASGAEDIARKFFVGVKNLFQVVRENVTAADRVAQSFASSHSFVNKASEVVEPFLRYNPAANDKGMFNEQYVSFNNAKASDQAQKFLGASGATLGDNGFNVDDRAESLVACTIVEVARGVRLSAVDQFVACEADYRTKLFIGRESIHLFPEEQVATSFEGRIEGLGDPNNRQRPLAPQLVVAMSSELILKAFTLSCAYGLIADGTFYDSDGAESTEVILTMGVNGNKRALPLSQSRLVRQLDSQFANVGPEEQLARLYLNALQNFNLKVVEKQGIPSQMVATMVDTLQRRGVSLGHIENPFTLRIRDLNNTVRNVVKELGPAKADESDDRRRDALNAKRRIDQHLQPFLENRVQSFQRSPLPAIRDMGTLMHLILHEEIGNLNRRLSGIAL